MILRYGELSRHRSVFQSMTGLQVAEFDQLVVDLEGRFLVAEESRLRRSDRERAPGGGDKPALDLRDQLLLSVVWLRSYPTHEVLGYLFGVSDSSVSRYVNRVVPLLAAAGRDTMKRPDPGRKRRKALDELLAETPGLAVIIDSFEQRVQRPKDRTEADGYYSGKKRQHTLKSQVTVDEETGEVVDISDSVPGPTADITLLKQSGVLERLPDGVGGIGDLAYVGADKLLEGCPFGTPRRKPRGKARPPEDIAFNRAFSRRRITVEHTIGRMRRFQSLTQTDRHHRHLHTARTQAVAGLVNRQLRRHLPRAA
jgi:transposase